MSTRGKASTRGTRGVSRGAATRGRGSARGGSAPKQQQQHQDGAESEPQHSSSSSSSMMVEVRVRGVLMSESDTHLWPFKERKGKRTFRVNVCSLPVVSRTVEYEIVGYVVDGGDVLYPRVVGLCALAMDDYVSGVLYNRPLSAVQSHVRARLDSSAESVFWASSKGRIARWAQTGFDDRVLNLKLDDEGWKSVGETSGFIREVQARSLRVGRNCVHEDEIDRERFAGENIGALFESGDLVLYNDEFIMMGSTYAALDRIDAACARVTRWTNSGGGSDSAERVPLLRILDDIESGRVTEVAGRPSGATRLCIYSGREEVVAVVDGRCATTSDGGIQVMQLTGMICEEGDGDGEGEGDGEGNKKKKKKKRAYANASKVPVDVAKTLGVVYATSDVHLGGARTLTEFTRDAFSRPSVGCAYKARDGSGVHVLRSVHGGVCVLMEGMQQQQQQSGEHPTPWPTLAMPLAEFWRRYVPFDVCYAWELEVTDVVVLVITHETTSADLVRAWDCARVALVVLGVDVHTLHTKLRELSLF